MPKSSNQTNRSLATRSTEPVPYPPARQRIEVPFAIRNEENR